MASRIRGAAGVTVERDTLHSARLRRVDAELADLPIGPEAPATFTAP